MQPSISSSNFYFERVGFEAKLNLRQNLKNGTNIIGRSDVAGVDIGLNSLLCSRKHCMVNVVDDSASVEDLNSSNGTTVNGNKISGVKVALKEGDMVGIVGGINPLPMLIGNYSFIVYRLCKYTTENIQTFEIEDDDPIVLSDDEDNVICLDSDGESIDIKEEFDLEMQLSRTFDIEMKKELEDIDLDLDLRAIELKMEPDDLPANETDENLNNLDEFYEIYQLNEDINHTAHPAVVNRHPDFMENNDSNESIQTVCFTTTCDQINDSNDSIQTVCVATALASAENKELSDSRGNASPLTDQTNMDGNQKEFEQKLKETVTKIKDAKEKIKKKRPATISAKPLVKRPRSKSEDSPPKDQRKSKTRSNKKEKLKIVASTSTTKTNKVTDEDKTHTFPKVKFTPLNRGAFLTDANQMPALPSKIQVTKRKEKEKAEEKLKLSVEKAKFNPEKVSLGTIPTPPELDQRIWEDMYSCRTPPDPIIPGVQKTSTQLPDSNTEVVVGMEIERPICEASEPCASMRYDDEPMHFDDDDVEMDSTEENENADDGDDEEIDVFGILMGLPPETARVRIIETTPKPTDLKSILKSNQSQPTKAAARKRRVTFKETGFQYDPRHKIISDVTAYDDSQFETVDDFCRKVDPNISSFADSYEDYKEYRSTLVSLMMVELWKEIEMEYVNSKIHAFTTVTINDKNLEKRGDGRRMVFHCQADSLYKSQSICDGHLVFAKCSYNDKEIEFLAFITTIAYSNKQENQKLAYFTMETAALTEILPIQTLEIRPITVITNTLNNFNAIYKLKQSPLKNLVINPVSEEGTSQHVSEMSTYKGYDPLDDTQSRILNTLYRRSINLDVPNISLLDGAAGTGKSCMIVNLALQLVYGDELPRPLRILICSKTNGGVNDLTKKFISIRDNTSATTKIQVVRFGLLEYMDPVVQRVSVQNLKEIEQHTPQFTSYEDLTNQHRTLQLKMTALSLDNDKDHSTNLKVLKKQLFKVNALLSRFEGLEKKKLRDTTTFILNSCDIICTNLGSIPKLQNYVSKVDVCIIDEASQCNEALTLLPFQFCMPSLILVGDSQLVPLASYSRVVKEKNYGNSLFARFQKLFLGKCGSPVFEMNFQYRIHQEILMWPNHQFYKGRLVPHSTVKDDSFPIAPYKLISYSLDKAVKESDNIMVLVKVLLSHVDWNTYTFAVICTNYKQQSILQNKLRDYPYITSYTADTYMGEKDVVIIWISEEHGINHLAHQQILNVAVTRAKKCLLICGANLTIYKNRPVWRSLLENANSRKCIQHFNTLTAPKVCKALKKDLKSRRNQCNLCKF